MPNVIISVEVVGDCDILGVIAIREFPRII